jgi:DegV family protein with EDD domain
MTYRIVSDSTSNLFTLSGNIDYKTVPLKILVDGIEYVDEPGLDTEALVAKMEASQWGSSTSCPAIQEWLDAFEGADYIFCVTITSGLSGSYNSALNARDIYVSEHPEAKIYVVDSLSTGGEMELIIEKIRECMEKNLPFEEAVQIIQDYQTHTHLLFTLESLSYLAINGRVPLAVAKVAGLLGIRFLGRASEEGTLQQAHICRGPKKTLTMSFSEMVKMGLIDSESDVIDFHVERVKKAYPAYFDTYENMDDLREYLDTIPNLFCVGRNGQHRYNNIDHSMCTSFETVKAILSGSTDKSAIWNVNTEKEYHEESKEEK